jgi:hypothetical protein
MTETAPALPLLSRYAIMVDVGYIYASAGELLFSAASRREYRVDADKLIQALTRHAEDHVRGELLRVYWYDAARDRVPTIVVWESDTVDVLERSFVEPFFTRQLSPEATPAAASEPGPARSGQAAPAQTVQGAPSPAQVFGERSSRQFSRPFPVPHLPSARLGPDRERVEEAGEHVAQKWILTRGEDNIRDLLPGPILPPVIDKELLVDAEKELGLSLRAYQEAREWLRDAFWARVHRQFGLGVGKSKG